MRVVFMGTPALAVPSLDALIAAGMTVPLVVAQPDRAAGRGGRMRAPPVARRAKELGLPLHQPGTVRNRAFLDRIASAEPDAVAVVAYGRILGPRVLSLPRLGCINVHASLLPAYRGAAPIQQAIMSGDDETGVTTMYMSEGLDEGDILLVAKTPIEATETSGVLGQRLSAMGAALLVETLTGLEAGTIEARAQDHAAASYAAPLTVATGHLDFRLPATELSWLIRGVHPWPGARLLLRGESIKIHTAEPLLEGTGEPGTVVAAGPEGLDVATGRGLLRIKRAQRPNRRALAIAELLRGWPIEPGERVESP